MKTITPSFPKSWETPYQSLARDIRSRAGGKKLLLVTHKGNWGDALIINGARNFLNANALAFTEVRGSRAIGRELEKTVARHDPDQYFPVFTAGGSISPLYGHLAKLRRASEAYRGGVVLPATCGLPFEELGLHPDCALWVREHGASAQNHPSGSFCHDMAFYTAARRFPKLRGDGVFMRRDKERPDDGTCEGAHEGLDLSAYGSDRSPVWPLLAIVGAHRKIRTNRLHIAIAAALCGVPCELSQGSTSKIRDVFEASISEYSQSVVLR